MKALLTLIVGFGLVLTSLGDPTKETTTEPVAALIQHSYLVDTKAFVRNLKQLVPLKSGESNLDLLRRFFKENNVKIGIQTSEGVFFNEKNGIIYINTTQAEIDKIVPLIKQILDTK